MPIESAVYVKFGETPGKPREPFIEGDTTDAEHYYWCELRNCGFELKAPDPLSAEEGDGRNAKETNKKFEAVTLKKRVDWASTQLFLKCCEAGNAKIEKSKADQKEQDKPGCIDVVTVEICKTAGGKKFPFIIIRYLDVQITHYQVNMSGPDPEETIKIIFGSFEVEYQRTSPHSGLPIDPPEKVGPIERDEDPTDDQAGDTPPGGGAGVAGTAGVATATGTGSNGSAALVSITDAAVSANFPGYAGGTGPGVLPG